MYRRNEFGLTQSGGVAALSRDQIVRARFAPPEIPSRFAGLKKPLQVSDFTPDLGVDIGSLVWWRGVVTCTLLCSAAVVITPSIKPLAFQSTAPSYGESWEETRAQSIAPLAWGSDTGRRLAANKLVIPLGNAPERPSITLSATFGQGDGFSRVLERAGLGSAEAKNVTQLISTATDVADITPGTQLQLTLGQRPNQNSPRPLDLLKVRARLDLSLIAARVGNHFELTRIPIAVDQTPLRIQGRVGEGLYRSIRAAGVPAKAVETYIKAIATKLSFERDIDASSKFDLVLEQSRAQTGEVERGRLLFAAMTTGNRQTRLIPWTIGEKTDWYDATEVGQRRSGMTLPIAGGRITSGFGMRFHPILGYARMHKGEDFGAAYGTPIHAVTDGLVAIAGRAGGYGNQIRLSHSSVLGTSYSHLSRILVRAGDRVSQGQVIGYVGSTGLSTGPHLHFEVYRNGAAVNPTTVSFQSSSLLNGKELADFRARVSSFLAVPVVGSAR